MDVVGLRVVGGMPVAVSHSWAVAEEGVGKVMPTYRDVGSAGRCLEQRRPTYGSHEVKTRKVGGSEMP